jgi:ferrochelatase
VKTAVVLMAYGSPSRPEDVGTYLSDIRGGRPVSPEAVEELAERYRRIGGGSPLNEITERQRAALEQELGIPVYVGMKHWTPRIAEAADTAVAGGADHIVGLVLAPHYARMSIGGYQSRLEEALAGRAELTFIASYHAHEPLIELLAEKAGVPSWSFAFQSESPTGEPWLGPDILAELERLHGKGVRKVLIDPIGFVADHLEIYWDIDTEAREKAAELGLELDRTESLNDDPAFIRVLAGVVTQHPAYAPTPTA